MLRYLDQILFRFVKMSINAVVAEINDDVCSGRVKEDIKQR
jgi:hypothetical protein